MCKGVGNFHHYQSHALSCNLRYLEALAAIDDPTPAYQHLRVLTEAQRQKGRSYAGFNPARQEEAHLFAAVLAGDHIAQGFRNKDIRQALYADTPKDPRPLSRSRRTNAKAAPSTWLRRESATHSTLACHRSGPTRSGRHPTRLSPL